MSASKPDGSKAHTGPVLVALRDMQDPVFLMIVGLSLAGSVGALLGAGVLLAFPGLQARLRNLLLSYAVGTLLGASFLGLLPGAIEFLGAGSALRVSLAAFLFFFFLEKILRLPHAHANTSLHDNAQARPAAVLVLISDSVHNFIDGVLIAVTVSSSLPLGIATAVAVIAHEVPQEFGDFVVLLEGGFGRVRAYVYNFLSSLSTLAGALLAYHFQAAIAPLVPYLLAFSGAGFLYVASTDLAPVLHHRLGRKAALAQFAGLLAGVATILLVRE